MKFTQQHIPEVKQPEAHVMPENKPTVVKPEKTPETVHRRRKKHKNPAVYGRLIMFWLD